MASGGKAVRSAEAEDSLTLKVNVGGNGQYRIVLRYSNQAVSATDVEISINGTVYKLYTPRTPYDDTFCTNAFYCDLYLRPSGPNEISVRCDQNILIDCIDVAALATCSCNDADKTSLFHCLCSVGHVVWFRFFVDALPHRTDS